MRSKKKKNMALKVMFIYYNDPPLLSLPHLFFLFFVSSASPVCPCGRPDSFPSYIIEKGAVARLPCLLRLLVLYRRRERSYTARTHTVSNVQYTHTHEPPQRKRRNSQPETSEGVCNAEDFE